VVEGTVVEGTNVFLHGHDRQPGVDAALGIEQIGQLPHGHSVAHGKREISFETARLMGDHRALDERAGNRIGAVQHNDFDGDGSATTRPRR
jgi:hypothetical protein